MVGADCAANRSLARGIDVIHALSVAQGPVGTRELARHLDESPSRVSRLLGTLSELGIAAQTGERKYIPGPGIHVLAAVLMRGSRLLSAALPELSALLAAGYGAALGVAWRDEGVISPRHARVANRAGHLAREASPLERSSIVASSSLLQLRSPAASRRRLARRGHAFSIPGPGEGLSVSVPIGKPALAALAAILRPGARPAPAWSPGSRTAGRIVARVGGGAAACRPQRLSCRTRLEIPRSTTKAWRARRRHRRCAPTWLLQRAAGLALLVTALAALSILTTNAFVDTFAAVAAAEHTVQSGDKSFSNSPG